MLAATVRRLESSGSSPQFTAVRPVIQVSDDSLAVDVLAELTSTPQEVILTDPNTGIFGVGSTGEEAVKDFLAALREHADVLSEQTSLSPHLQGQLDYLRAHLNQQGRLI